MEAFDVVGRVVDQPDFDQANHAQANGIRRQPGVVAEDQPGLLQVNAAAGALGSRQLHNITQFLVRQAAIGFQ
ncbi:hypothetical protein D3C86_2093380 [compost metagenome]